MPLPKTRNVGKLISKMMAEDPHHVKMPHKQMVAIALSQARKAGAKIPKKEMPKQAKRSFQKAKFIKKTYA